MSSVGEDFPAEQARCRELLKVYESIGPPGVFASACLRLALEDADKALASGDPAKIIAAYRVMTGFKS